MVLAGYGLNCEEETKFAFDLAGARTDIVHLADLIASPKTLQNYQILAIPGGFAFGDDTGSGKAYANKMRNHLADKLAAFKERDTLMIGICNGFQILTNLGFLPGALTLNDNARYTDRFVDIRVAGEGPWLAGIKTLSVPIAHGEGKFYADTRALATLEKKRQIAFTYAKGEMSRYLKLPANPNGSLKDIAGVTDETGRVLGIMPHPERAMFMTQLPNWTLLREEYRRRKEPFPEAGPGLRVFQNAADYFVKN